jgi:hypothetical protein
MARRDEEEEDRSWHSVRFDEDRGRTDNYFGSHSGEREKSDGGSAPDHGHVAVNLSGDMISDRDEGQSRS